MKLQVGVTRESDVGCTDSSMAFRVSGQPEGRRLEEGSPEGPP